MNFGTISVALLLLSVYSGYLAAKWANNWSYWSHRWCAMAIIALAWLALPAKPSDEKTSRANERDKRFFVAADVAQEAFRLMKEREHGPE